MGQQEAGFIDQDPYEQGKQRCTGIENTGQGTVDLGLGGCEKKCGEKVPDKTNDQNGSQIFPVQSFQSL